MKATKRYTAVFEFKESPNIRKCDSWLGGKLCIVAFNDVIKELVRLQAKMEIIQEWYETDGTLGSMSKIMEDDDDE
jgi:hypothetical protein